MKPSLKEHHLFLSSTDSLAFFPNNKAIDFHVEFSEALNLSGRWTCALTQIAFKDELVSDIVVLCDICESSYINNTRLPVLRVIPQSNSNVFIFTQPFRLNISRDEIKRLRLYIRTTTLEEPLFLSQPVTCSLHLRRT